MLVIEFGPLPLPITVGDTLRPMARLSASDCVADPSLLRWRAADTTVARVDPLTGATIGLRADTTTLWLTYRSGAFGAVSGRAIAFDSLPLFRTDSSAYHLNRGSVGWEATIRFAFTNRTREPAYIVNCNGSTILFMQRFVDGAWTFGWAPIVPACLSAPIDVQPGATYRGEVQLFAGYSGTNYEPKFATSDPNGTYHIIWNDVLRTYQDRLPFGDPLPIALRTSNRFSLIVGPRPAGG